MRRAIWPLLALLASCAPQRQAALAPPHDTHAQDGTACSAGPDGGPNAAPGGRDNQIADRGIGGTGVRPAAAPAPAAAMETADRGIGGTGVIGVVTGFASICVSGTRDRVHQRCADLHGRRPPPRRACCARGNWRRCRPPALGMRCRRRGS